MAGGWAAFGTGFLGGLARGMDRDQEREFELQKARDAAVLQTLTHMSTQFPSLYSKAVSEARSKRNKYEAVVSLTGDPRIADQVLKAGIDPHTKEGQDFISRAQIEGRTELDKEYKSTYLQGVQDQLETLRSQGNSTNAQLNTMTQKPQRQGLMSRMFGQPQQPQSPTLPQYEAVDVTGPVNPQRMSVAPDLSKDRVIDTIGAILKSDKPGVFASPADRGMLAQQLTQYEALRKAKQTPEVQAQAQALAKQMMSLVNPRDATASAHDKSRQEREALARSAGYKPDSFGWNHIISSGTLPKAGGIDVDSSGQMVKSSPGVSASDQDRVYNMILKGLGAAQVIDAAGNISQIDQAQGPTAMALANEAIRNFTAAKQAREAEGKPTNDLNIADFATGAAFKHLGRVYENQYLAEEKEAVAKKPGLDTKEFKRAWLKRNPDKSKILEIITRAP